MSDVLDQSLCILGRQPALGLAELESLYGAAAVSLLTPQVAALAISSDAVDFKRLGGSTRLARVVTEVPSKLWKDVEKQLIKTVVELAGALPEGKLQLGLSAFDIPITPAKLVATGLTIKKVVRAKTERSLRLTPNNELELNTAQVLHNHLTGQTGIELLIIATGRDTTLLAVTTDVQDIDGYTIRDRGRPKRDARVGMLPPKLAQIIINLINPAPSAVILDPFCGTGVLLQEALLMGYGAYGSDLEARMVDYSKENLDWLGEKYVLPTSHIFLEKADATTFQNHDTIDAIASETYLGRPFTDRPSAEILAQTLSDTNLIIKKFLKNIHAQLAPGTPLCLAVPAWQTAPGVFRHLPLIDQLHELGYNRTRFEHVRDTQLLYYREDQIVARQLLVITRK